MAYWVAINGAHVNGDKPPILAWAVGPSDRANTASTTETALASVYQCFATLRSDAQRENTYIDVSNIAQQCVVSKITIVLQTPDQIGRHESVTV
jgi:hypothetical protein